MRNFILSFMAIAAVLIGAVFFVAIKENSSKNPVIESQSGRQVSVKIPGKMTFEVEIADNSLAHARGLSNRDSLEAGRGMLFVFPSASIQKFWMKDMRFPLDIVWIKNDIIVGVVYGAEPDNSGNLTIYDSPEPVDKVLEVNAGEIAKYNIKVGDSTVVSL